MGLFEKFQPSPPEPPRYYDYRTRNGQTIIKARIQKVKNIYEIDLLELPDLSKVKSDYHTTHRLPSQRPDCVSKICVKKGKEPRDLETAERFLVEYAELLEAYRVTKIDLDTQLIMRN